MTAGVIAHTGLPQPTEPALTADEVARCEQLYRAMEANHRLLVHIDEATAREQLAVNTLAETGHATPWHYAPRMDALRRYLRAQLAAYDRWLAGRAQSREETP